MTRIVYHECFHDILADAIGEVPLGLNERLAEFFATLRTEGQNAFVQRHPIEEHVAYLSRNRPIPWGEVIDATTDSPVYRDEDRQGAFYRLPR